MNIPHGLFLRITDCLGGLFSLEHILAYAAQRADIIVREILPLGACCDAVIGLAYCLVIDITANGANILFHDDTP